MCAVAVADCSLGLADCILAADSADEPRRCAETSQVQREIDVVHNLWRADIEDRGALWHLSFSFMGSLPSDTTVAWQKLSHHGPRAAA